MMAVRERTRSSRSGPPSSRGEPPYTDCRGVDCTQLARRGEAQRDSGSSWTANHNNNFLKNGFGLLMMRLYLAYQQEVVPGLSKVTVAAVGAAARQSTLRRRLVRGNVLSRVLITWPAMTVVLRLWCPAPCSPTSCNGTVEIMEATRGNSNGASGNWICVTNP